MFSLIRQQNLLKPMPRLKQFLLLLFAFFVLLDLQAQNNRKFYAKNAKEIDEKRYEDYRGSPYFFSQFVTGTIIDNADNEYPNVRLNLNGYTDELEVEDAGFYVALQESFYKSFTAKDKDGNEYLFKSNLHPNFKDKFFQVLHESDEVLLIKEFDVIPNEKVINNVGETLKVKIFGEVNDYMLLTGLGKQDITKLKISKKKLPEILGMKKDLAEFIKSQKLSFKKDQDLITLIKHYETLL